MTRVEGGEMGCSAESRASERKGVVNKLLSKKGRECSAGMGN